MKKQRKKILVFDYDRTLTINEPVIPEQTKESLKFVSDAGRENQQVLLGIVSGRLLPFLKSVNTECSDSFSFLVAENGAVIFDGISGSKEVIGSEWAKLAMETFEGSGLPIRFGEVMGASKAENAQKILEIASSHGLDISVVRNRGSALFLPPGVGKGPGVSRAILRYGERGDIELTSFGDGENDVSLFEPADIKVAVSNAVPELKQIADIVTQKPGGLGVDEYLRNRFMS